MQAVFLDQATLDYGDIDLAPLRAVATLQCYPHTAPDEVVTRLRGAQVVISNKVVLDAATIAQLPDLQLICIAATGTNNVDLAAAAERGIPVCNCQGYGTASVAQHVIAMMLTLATRMLDYQAAVRRGDWARSPQFCLLDYPIMELRGKTLGLIGYGELGREVARLAQAFGMTVAIAARPGTAPADGREALDALLPRVDVLSLHCPLTEQTRGLMNAKRIRTMKPGALLINAARGGIVDEEALRSALLDGHLGGAGVDVLTEEPPRNGNPLLDSAIPNLIVTPHSAWGSCEARQTIVAQLAENIAAYQQGAPHRVIA